VHGDFRIGAWLIQPQLHTIARDAQVTHVEPKAMQVLVYLAEHVDQVVPKERLISAVWTDTFVTDGVLIRCISELRKAFDEDANDPKVIGTIPRGGYRLIAPVVPVAPEETEAAATAKPQHTKRLVLVLLTVILAGVGVLAYIFRPSLEQPRVVGFTQITHDGHQKNFDGQVIATVLTDGPRIYVQENIDGRFVVGQVPSSGGEIVPLWTLLPNIALYGLSPDKTELVVGSFGRTEQDVKLWSIPVSGGPPRNLGWSGADANWMQNGELLLANNNALDVIAKDHVSKRRFASLSGLPYWLRWSPDGRFLRFTLQGVDTHGPTIWEISSDGSHLHPLPLNLSIVNASRGSWSPDGKYFIFQASHPGGLDIWAVREKGDWFHRVNHKPVRLTSGPLNYHSPEWSADGRKIFVVGELMRAELHRYDRAHQTFVPYLEGISLESVDFSSNGQWMTYIAYPHGELWRSRMDGTDKVQLLSPPPYVAMPRWSPDGNRIVCVVRETGKGSRISIIAKDGGIAQDVYVSKGELETPTWMPDARNIAFGEFMDPYSADAEIKLLNLDTREITIVPHSKGLSRPVLSPDGQHLAAVTANSQTLKLFDFTTHEWTELAKMSLGSISWSSDSRFIYFDCGMGDKAGFFRVRVSTHQTEKLFSTRGFQRLASGWTPWSGISPQGEPLLLRDASTQEVYALHFSP
jgi:DNA-binding winged helix-turn-helix (wHTH) protein/Tol biopolymer transport system component